MFKRLLYYLYGKSTVRKARRLTKEGILILMTLLIWSLGGGRTSFAYLLALLLILFLWSRFFRLRVHIQRILPKFGTVGEPLEYRIILHNATATRQNGLYLVENLEGSRLTFAEFVNTPAPGEEELSRFSRISLGYRRRWLGLRKQGARVREFPLPTLLPHGKAEIRAEMIPVRRGHIQLTGLTIARPDPLHLYKALLRIPLRQSVLILPKRYDIPAIRLPGMRKFQIGGIALASSVGESQEFASLREYRPGDPLRRIHWKSWAKTGKPIVKEYHDEYFVRHALVLDTFQQAAYSELFEEAVSVAASFACTVRTQDSLLDLMFVGPEAYCLTIGRGLAHTEQMLEILASVTPCQERPFSVLPALVCEHAPLLSGCICILLTWDEDRQHFIAALKQHGVPVLVLVVTDEETSQSFDSGSLKESPGQIQILEVGKIQEGLSAL